jgi:hypothetical protein
LSNAIIRRKRKREIAGIGEHHVKSTLETDERRSLTVVPHSGTPKRKSVGLLLTVYAMHGQGINRGNFVVVGVLEY